MKEWISDFEVWAADVIFGRARGLRARLTHWLLWFLSLIFRLLIKLRLWLFEQGWKGKFHLGTLVISVGNITVGGTGKTPVVELLSKTLQARGRKIAILSRGYKSRALPKPQVWKTQKGLTVPAEAMPKVVSAHREILLNSKFAGDEPFMLAKNLPEVAVLVDKDRVKSARFAIQELEADTLILDDGMQYIRLAHAYDLVLVDSKAPFGTGSVLPNGTLREPVSHLKRASYILLTRCDGTSNEALIKTIKKHNPVADIIESSHHPMYLENYYTKERLPLSFLKQRYMAVISGIAAPENFERNLKDLGADIAFHRIFSDHHRFTRKEMRKFMDRCLDRDVECILTTEKDAVRFPETNETNIPVYFLRIEVEIIQGKELWDQMIEHFCNPHAPTTNLIRWRGKYFS